MQKPFLRLCALVCLLAACSKDSPDPYHINNWIWDEMKRYYLWEANIAARPDQTLDPAAFFAALLHKPDDRFSWIQENYTDLLNMLSGVQREAGYDFAFYHKTPNSQELAGCITYTKPRSPAEQAGIRRGDMFIAINSEAITTANYRTLAGKLGSPHTLSFADPANLQTEVRSVDLQVTEYRENPILLDSVYVIEGKRIGYLVYNFFARDNGDGSLAYEKELNALFGKLGAAAIDDLIIDLRYNGGGAVSVCIALASMISGLPPTKVFGIAQYNQRLSKSYQQAYGNEYDKDFFVNTAGGNPIHSIGMNRLYVITSSGTASASELLINGLRPYMHVYIVGDTTYGKNVGSYSLYQPNNPNNKWGMQPIVVRFANKDNNSDYGNGFVPDVNVREAADGFPLKQLGDTGETMLRTTLDLLLGRAPQTQGLARGIRVQERELWNARSRTPARRSMYVELPAVP